MNPVFWAVLWACGQSAVVVGKSATRAELAAQATGLAGISEGPVVVRGKVGQVCEMGCWFYLLDARDLVYVKLDLATGLKIPPDSGGRDALVAGTLVGHGPDRQLVAETVILP